MPIFQGYFPGMSTNWNGVHMVVNKWNKLSRYIANVNNKSENLN